ncbi:hypothetical protein CSA56_03695 [candidate division KSB3 bacterium]|uniref:histidine kinase n=1 Tax=candidate division KSB3 bacterium TaxID=2044937 RepID=A0A2G6KIW8_9BACT|nr:MAG: hypothetical protein CSA56_03695 [candidate division KSB3 bacterium]
MGENFLSNATILIVDDNPTNLEILSNYFMHFGYRILTKKSGEEMFQSLKDDMPDLILLDIVMPGIDGFEICRRLKDDNATKDIPIIFMTALSDTMDKIKGFEAGAVDYITKPFQREEVLVRAKTHLLLQSLKKNLQAQNQILQQSLERERKMMEELRLSLSLSLPHELRTPLTGILGYASFLASPAKLPTPEQVLQYGKTIYENSLRLYRLVENSLLYANLRLLKYTSKEKPQWQSEHLLNPTKMIASIARQHAKDAHREHDLALDLNGAYVRISPTNFEKIFTELLDNALKYSQLGSPISIKTATNGNLWILSITDKGRGMTKEQLTNIGAYMQFGREQCEQQGIGLGLTIAQLLAQLEGGMLSIKSEPNHGTTVSLVLNGEELAPDKLPDERESYWFDTTLVSHSSSLVREAEQGKSIQGYRLLSLSHSETSFARLKVLVIDTTLINGVMFSNILTPLGFDVFEAFDEFDGINKNVKYSPDLIFLDITHCELESIKTMYQVQRLDNNALPVKILAIADPHIDAAQKNLWLYWCDEVIERPLHLQNIFKLLQSHLPLTWIYNDD